MSFLCLLLKVCQPHGSGCFFFLIMLELVENLLAPFPVVDDLFQGEHIQVLHVAPVAFLFEKADQLRPFIRIFLPENQYLF